MKTFQKSGTNKACASPTVRDLEWAAGFIEGEGSFPNMKHPRVCVTQKNLEPLQRLVRLFGGRIYSVKNRDWAIWQISGPRARGVMMTLYSLMSKRRRGQIRLMLQKGQPILYDRVGAARFLDD